MNMHLYVYVYVYVNVYVNANAYAYVYVYIWLQVERGSPLLPLSNAFTLVTPWFFRRFQSVTLQSYYVDATSCNVREGACTNPKPKNLPGIPGFPEPHFSPVYIRVLYMLISVCFRSTTTTSSDHSLSDFHALTRKNIHQKDRLALPFPNIKLYITN